MNNLTNENQPSMVPADLDMPALPPAAPYPDPGKAISQALSTIWIYLITQAATGAGLGIVAGIVIGFIVAASAYISLGSFENDLSLLLSLAATVISGVLTIVLRMKPLQVDVLGLLKNQQYKKRALMEGVLLAYALSLPCTIVLNLLNELLYTVDAQIPEEGFMATNSLTSVILFLLMACVAAPILEEIVFRGLVLRPLARLNRKFAVVFSALLFGMVHLNLYQGIPTFGIGLALAIIALKTDSLQVCIFVHFFNNMLACLINFFPQFSFIFSILILLLSLAGWIWLIWKMMKERQESAVLQQSEKASGSLLWKAVWAEWKFWLLFVLFIIASISSIFGIL